MQYTRDPQGVQAEIGFWRNILKQKESKLMPALDRGDCVESEYKGKNSLRDPLKSAMSMTNSVPNESVNDGNHLCAATTSSAPMAPFKEQHDVQRGIRESKKRTL